MWVFPIATGVAFICTYILLLYLLPKLFTDGKHTVKSNVYQIRTIIPLFLGSILLSSISVVFPHSFLGDSIQHAIGGGFLAFVVFFIAMRNTEVVIPRVSFFILGFLLVTTLGVGYELLEFLGETTTGIIFQTSHYDTWFDLLNNTIGALVGGIFLAYYYPHITTESIKTGGSI